MIDNKGTRKPGSLSNTNRRTSSITRAKTVAQKVLSDSSQSDTEAVVQMPPCSRLKSTCNSASPSGVNRITAVLFTRKAQTALKKPEQIAKRRIVVLNLVKVDQDLVSICALTKPAVVITFGQDRMNSIECLK